MKTIVIFSLLQIIVLSIISGQKESVESIYRDWYAVGYGDKDLNIGDTLTFDTTKLDPKDNSNFVKWGFERNGSFTNLNVRIINDFGEKGGENVIAMSTDDVKWKLNKGTDEIIIDFSNVEGYDKYKAIYKIIKLSKSKLILKKLTKMQPPNMR